MLGARVQAVARRLPQPRGAAVVRETYAPFAVGIAGLAQPVFTERADAAERGLGLRSQVAGLSSEVCSRVSIVWRDGDSAWTTDRLLIFSREECRPRRV